MFYIPSSLSLPPRVDQCTDCCWFPKQELVLVLPKERDERRGLFVVSRLLTSVRLHLPPCTRVCDAPATDPSAGMAFEAAQNAEHPIAATDTRLTGAPVT